MKKQTIALSILLINILIITGCASETQATAASEVTYTPVTVSEVVSGHIEEDVIFTGQARPNKEIDIYGSYSGEIASTNFGVGGKVSQGDVLFSFDVSNMQNNVDALKSQVDSAKAAVSSANLNVKITSGSQQENQILQMESSLNSAKISYDNAKKNFDNASVLLGEGFVSQVEYDNVEQGYLQAKVAYETLMNSYTLLTEKQLSESISLAQNQLQQAEASKEVLDVQYRNALDTLEDLNVTSPIDGLIATKSIDVGEIYNSSYPAYSVIDMDTVVITINVPEGLINSVDLEDQVYVSFNTLDDRNFIGTIREISPVPNDMDLTYPVKLEIDNKDHLIKPGMFAEIRMIKNQANGIVVDRNSLELSDGHWYAYTVADGTVHVEQVEIGLDNGFQVEIINGLEEGQQLVVTGREYVVDGEQVTIIQSGGE